MINIVNLIDKVIENHENDNIINSVKKDVNELMKGRELFNY